MKTLTLTVSLILVMALRAESSGTITKQQYAESWKKTAMEQMVLYRIPASITLAQGILESASGNSELAQKGNNHFGIKCHDWDGDKMYLDDDKKGECFRVYKKAEDSYIDHSAFLKKHNRYAFLFDLGVDDYKSWAKGLKDAGYATNPKYPDLLIGIIEDLNLNEYDKTLNPELDIQPQLAAKNQNSNEHMVLDHEQGVKYVVVKKGDTFYKIADEFGLSLRQLYRYNDFDSQKDVLVEGDIIYLQPKRKRKLFNKNEVVLDKEMTVQEISQKYATNVKTLQRLNDFSREDNMVSKGEKITLR